MHYLLSARRRLSLPVALGMAGLGLVGCGQPSVGPPPLTAVVADGASPTTARASAGVTTVASATGTPISTTGTSASGAAGTKTPLLSGTAAKIFVQKVLDGVDRHGPYRAVMAGKVIWEKVPPDRTHTWLLGANAIETVSIGSTTWVGDDKSGWRLTPDSPAAAALPVLTIGVAAERSSADPRARTFAVTTTDGLAATVTVDRGSGLIRRLAVTGPTSMSVVFSYSRSIKVTAPAPGRVLAASPSAG